MALRMLKEKDLVAGLQYIQVGIRPGERPGEERLYIKHGTIVRGEFRHAGRLYVQYQDSDSGGALKILSGLVVGNTKQYGHTLSEELMRAFKNTRTNRTYLGKLVELNDIAMFLMHTDIDTDTLEEKLAELRLSVPKEEEDDAPRMH